MVEQAWQAFSERVLRLETLGEIRSLLEWDMLVLLPPQGSEARSDHSALLARLFHEEVSAPALGDLLQALEAAPHLTDVQRAGTTRMRRLHDRAVRLPVTLVEATERARTVGYQRWVQAREANDYRVFEPALAELVHLARETARCLATPDTHPYTVLLDEFEHGATLQDVRPVLDRLAGELRALLHAVGDRPAPAPLGGTFPVEGQRRLFHEVARAMGFDFDAGRLDTAVHPFTSSMGPRDTRITTRFAEDNLFTGLYALIHEAGHGLYEQGLPAALRGTGAGGAASMGLHESQSRFWENVIGGSLPFHRWLAPRIQAAFPGCQVDASQLHGACNRVVPSLIRIEADEVTYNLHIQARFELEVALVSGDLATTDLEGAWNDAYGRLLGVRPPDALSGVLQDVHWSGGMFGYFPTYTLGNLYAAGLAAALEDDLPDLWERVERGDLAPVLEWLRSRVHSQASLGSAASILQGAIGHRDLVEDLVGRLWRRQGALHGVQRPLRAR